ncbi:MAG: hypothetical protein ACOWYE_10180 [Desulfatiglandales bacterium]
MAEMKKEEGMWISVFIPNVRTLTENEIAELPAEKRRAAEGSGTGGTWLKVLCPDASCVKSGGKITLNAEGIEKEAKGLWLDVFCPDDSCLYKTGTELP